MRTTSAPTPSRLGNWLLPASLLALAFIPVVAGAVRMTELASGGGVTTANLRFFASPVPVLVHIIGATVFSVLGAFQFSTGIRRRWPAWHRAAGRVLLVAGMAAALSGLWMAQFYAIVPADSPLLHAFRLFFGGAMALSLVLGLDAIRRRKIGQHQAWMRRAFAIGLGAGTQALIQIPYVMTLGKPDPDTLALLMGAAWLINLAVSELPALLPRRRPAVELRTALPR